MARSRRREKNWLFREFGGVPNWATVAVLCLLGAMGLYVAWDQSQPDPSPHWTPAAQSNEPEPSISPSPDPVVTVERPEDDPLSVIFLGDSLTGNLHASSSEAGFRALTVAGLSESGEVIESQANRAHATTSEVFEGAPLGEDHDLAVIQLGTNDVGREVPLDDFREDYRDTLAAFRQSSPDVQFVCLGTWQAPGVGAPYDAIIEEECESMGGAFRALDDLATDPEMVGPSGNMDVVDGPSDNFHPNDDGHAAIAERLLGAVAFG